MNKDEIGFISSLRSILYLEMNWIKVDSTVEMPEPPLSIRELVNEVNADISLTLEERIYKKMIICSLPPFSEEEIMCAKKVKYKLSLSDKNGEVK